MLNIISLTTSLKQYLLFLYHLEPVSFWALVVLLFYTYFTYRLWRESINQTGLNLMPIPAFYFDEEAITGRLRVGNLGNKPLFNLIIEDWILIIYKRNEKPNVWKLIYSVPFPNIIKSGEERTLELKTCKNGKASSNSIWPHLHPDYNKKQKVPMRICFQDVRGIKYNAKFSMGKGELAMIKPPKARRYYSFITVDLFDLLVNFLNTLWFKLIFKVGLVK